MNKVKILLFAANPVDTIILSLDEEIREITQKIRASKHRDVLDLVYSLAARPDDWLQALNEHEPQIVHFSGHGSPSGEIICVDDNRTSKPVSPEAIKSVFQAFDNITRVVLLNACYSQIQAEAIRDNIDCVIGMNDDIGDEAAIKFAASFYRAIGFGWSVQKAFEQGKAALQLEGIPEEDKLELLCKPGVDPKEILLIQPDAITLAAKSRVDRKISDNTYSKIKLLIEKELDNGSRIIKEISELEDNPMPEEHLERLAEEVAATTADKNPKIREVFYDLLNETSSQPEPEEIVLSLRDKFSGREKAGSQPEPEEVKDLDVPCFDFFREIPPTKSIHTKGIQFTDKDPENYSDPPILYLSVYFKNSKYFVPYPLSTNEKWLYLEANMRPALNLRIQVSANMRDVEELMKFLHNSRDGWDMHGPRPANDQAGDYFYVWRENDENRLMISTFTPTNAGISIHARFSSEVAKAFADYLEEVGFTKPFKE